MLFRVEIFNAWLHGVTKLLQINLSAYIKQEFLTFVNNNLYKSYTECRNLLPFLRYHIPIQLVFNPVCLYSSDRQKRVILQINFSFICSDNPFVSNFSISNRLSHNFMLI